MPCHDYGYDEWIEKQLKNNPDAFIEKKLNMANAELQELVQYLKDRLDKATRLLCFVCKNSRPIMRNMDSTDKIKMLAELNEWWREHQEWDKQRENNNATK